MRRVAGACGGWIVQITPRAVRERVAPYARYADMLLSDHLVIRLLFPNRHQIADGVWRSAQPLPHQIESLTGLGIRTVVNLRCEFQTSTYALERAACERASLQLIDFRVRSRAAPARETLLEARKLFDSLEYPVLMHCKSGADRVGLMSALYLHHKCGVPIEEAKKQLSLRFGHIRHADTGVLDYFFERYLADTAKKPMPFFDWVEAVYDADEVKASFKARGWANRIVNSILKRE